MARYLPHQPTLLTDTERELKEHREVEGRLADKLKQDPFNQEALFHLMETRENIRVAEALVADLRRLDDEMTKNLKTMAPGLFSADTDPIECFEAPSRTSEEAAAYEAHVLREQEIRKQVFILEGLLKETPDFLLKYPAKGENIPPEDNNTF
jgi:hypothetical protein